MFTGRYRGVGRRLLVTLFVAVGVCLLNSPVPSSAQPSQRGLNTQVTEKVDAVLVLDTSGSMLINDPRRLRDEGARLFLQFLKPGDQLAVIEFSAEANIVRPLSPYDPAQLDSVAAQISGLPTKGEYTDLLGAVQKAKDVLQTARTDARPVIVLLSDGRMEPNPDVIRAPEATRRLLEEVLPEMRSQGKRIYTLAFSNDADRDLLNQIAASTDAVMWFTPDAEKVHQSYADLFLAVKKPQVIPLSVKGFPIDSGVDEATFYLTRAPDQEVTVQTPGGLTYRKVTVPPNIRWFSGEKFDVITITKPEQGVWRLAGINPDEGFATILTNLKLITDWPTAADAGREELLQARLYEGEKPIALPEMTGAVRYAFQITPTDKVAEPVVRDLLVDDGTRGDKIANDGIFSAAVSIAEPGEYRMRLVAQAPTFERQLQIPFRVRPPLLTLSIHEASAEAGQHAPKQEASDEDDEHSSSSVQKVASNAVVRLEVADDGRGLRNIQAQIVAVDSAKRRYTLPLKRVGESGRLFDTSLAALPKDGNYELRASISAELPKRGTVRESSRPLEILLSGVEPESVPIVIEDEKTPAEPKESAGFPIVGILIVTVLNVAVGALALMLLKKSQGNLEVGEKLPQVPEELLAGVQELEARAAATEVDVNALLAEIEEAPIPEPAPEAQETA